MSPRSSARRRARTRPAPAPAAPPRAPWTARIRAWHVAVLLAALHLALSAVTLNPAPDAGGDNAAYLALARSLAETGTYRELWDPAAPPHTQYPPGWPLMMAAGLKLGAQTWIAFKWMAMAFYAAAVALAYLWARRVSTAGVALGVGIVLATGPGVLDLSHLELSDVPFWTFGMLALWGFARYAPRQPIAPGAEEAPAEESAPGRALGALAVATVATLLAYFTRSAALPLVVAAAGWLAWQRRWRGLALFGGVVGPFAAAWWLRGRALGEGGYTGYLWYVDPYQPELGLVTPGGMLARIVENAGKYVSRHLPELVAGLEAGPDPALLATALGAGIVGLGVAGWAMRLRRPGLAEVWLPLYLGLVLIWPAEWAGTRFLLPAVPVILLYAGEAVAALARRTPRPRLAGVAVVGALVLVSVPTLRAQAEITAYCRKDYANGNVIPCFPPTWNDFLGLAATMRGRLPEGSAVIARKPTLWWAFSGYPSRVFPYSAEPDSLLRAAREAGARYVVMDYTDNVSPLYVAPIIMQRPQAFCVMHSLGSERAAVMGILPGADTMQNLRDRPGTETVELRFSACPPDFWAPGMALPLQ